MQCIFPLTNHKPTTPNAIVQTGKNAWFITPYAHSELDHLFDRNSHVGVLYRVHTITPCFLQLLGSNTLLLQTKKQAKTTKRTSTYPYGFGVR